MPIAVRFTGDKPAKTVRFFGEKRDKTGRFMGEKPVKTGRFVGESQKTVTFFVTRHTNCKIHGRNYEFFCRRHPIFETRGGSESLDFLAVEEISVLNYYNDILDPIKNMIVTINSFEYSIKVPVDALYIPFVMC